MVVQPAVALSLVGYEHDAAALLEAVGLSEWDSGNGFEQHWAMAVTGKQLGTKLRMPVDFTHACPPPLFAHLLQPTPSASPRWPGLAFLGPLDAHFLTLTRFLMYLTSSEEEAAVMQDQMAAFIPSPQDLISMDAVPFFQ